MFKRKEEAGARKIKPAQVIILGFLALITVGTLLLMLPFATASGKSAGFADALFTATSASCVTGLVVQDTATYWSGFGQAVILFLIQIGGLGVVTMAIAVTIVTGKRIGLAQRNLMQESISASQIGGIVKLTRFILLTAAAIELIGALLLMPVMISDFGVGMGIWKSFFHSISAFCNAGFDLMGGTSGHYSSITKYYANPLVVITVCLLILVGGIGFHTWADIREKGIRFSRYRMQSKTIFLMTGILVLFPALWFFFFEFDKCPMGDRFLLSFFQAVTPRTAGFNTADLTKLSDSGILMMIVLMLIGGGPAGTAGGMKITTVAVLFVSSFSVFTRKKEAVLFRRKIPEDAIKNAIAILLLYITLFTGGAFVISAVEHIPMLTCLFETASAVGTVGLTLGITPGLSMVSRAILVVLMYVGRVGGLTLIFAAMSEKRDTNSRHPEEKITVG